MVNPIPSTSKKQDQNPSVIYWQKQKPLTKRYIMVTDKIASSLEKMTRRIQAKA